MTILSPLKDNTIRLLKYEYDGLGSKPTFSILESDTKGALQTDKNDLVTYPVTQLETIDTSEYLDDNF